ncbi:MAG: GHKL domain-containing protein [Desulfobacteraceae bacterium]|nr:GHKL domain-containing protein [Desulfobacteraceae bacterium]
MQTASQNFRSEEKQFRLVKFFAWGSFIVIVIFSFPFSMVISQQAKEILLRSYENNAILVGDNLNHQVFQNFVIPVNYRYGGIRLRDREQSELMDKIIQNAIHGLNVDLVNVYDIGKGVIAYSTDPAQIGKKVRESLGYKRAIKGERSSGLISTRDELWGLDIDFMGGKKTLRTYIPFRVENPYTGSIGIGGVFELIQDMSKQYESIVKFQYLTFGLSILIMGLIFLALLLIVQKAERMIEQRAQEQRELESQLHLAERLAALGEMVAGISHEIKNPLGIIRSTAELLGEMPDANDIQKRLSGVIREESTRLNQIVTEFLDFARPQVPNLHECQLEEIIEKNLSFIRPELEKKGIQVQDNLNGRSFRLRADHDLLYRAFLNILINAIQSMQDGGTIDIKVEEARDTYQIEIEDTGCGISEENADKIFNPFFTTKEKGSGLGLSIVRKIIEGHRGTIDIQNREGEGTKVEVHLPRKG